MERWRWLWGGACENNEEEEEEERGAVFKRQVFVLEGLGHKKGGENVSRQRGGGGVGQVGRLGRDKSHKKRAELSGFSGNYYPEL